MGIDPIAAVAELRDLAHKAVEACRQRGLIVDVGDIDRRFDQVEMMGLTADNGMSQRELVRSALRIGGDVEAKCKWAWTVLN
jgi:hypothetical protein